MSGEFERLEREDVVSLYAGQILVTNRTFTISEFITAMMTLIKAQAGWTEEKASWFGDGIDCKMLKPGAKSWQRGKVRLTLEFVSEELEVKETSELEGSQEKSTLDDLRQRIPKDG